MRRSDSKVVFQGTSCGARDEEDEEFLRRDQNWYSGRDLKHV